MKQFAITFSTIILFIFCMNACKKEMSYETGNGANGNSAGTITDSFGNCQQIIAKGTYKVDTVLTDSNYLLVQLNITSRGRYKVSTDSSNGFWFIDSGYALNTGLQTVKIKGYGKPLLPIVATKTVTYDSTFCQINIDCGALPLISNADYFPTTIGSNWTYFVGTSLTDTFTTTVSNLYAIIGTNAYSIFTTPYPTFNDTSFYRKDGNGNYYQLVSLLDTSSGPIDFPFLKDYKNVNDTWESDTVQGISYGQYVTVKYGFTIIAKNQSYAFNNIMYNNVIKVREDYYEKALSAPSFSAALDYDYAYYAQGIGWIATQYPNEPIYNITVKSRPVIK